MVTGGGDRLEPCGIDVHPWPVPSGRAISGKAGRGCCPGAIVSEYGTLSLQPTPFPLFTALTKGLAIRGYTLLEITRNPEKLPAARKYIYDLSDGRFHPKVATTFPFAQTVEAYKYLESNAQVGKVVIIVP